MSSAVPLARARPAVADEAVAVVVTTYNHARCLGEALASVIAQTRSADEIIVIDDGSTDAPEKVVASFPGVRLVHQANLGLASARNAGLRATRSRFILFLDADDRLLPKALELGLAAHARNPGAALVYGGHRHIDESGAALGDDRFEPIVGPAFPALLQGNLIAMHAAALFDRGRLVAAGGYDPELRRAEDYDLYLRLARRHAIAAYPETVAEYRLHRGTLSADRRVMLAAVEKVLERHAAGLAGSDAAAAEAGRRIWRRNYAGRSADRKSPLRRLAGRVLPKPVKTVLRRRLRLAAAPPGRWHWGDFGRGEPASRDFGYDRGAPIDRYYIEGFLSRNAADIAGSVLEIGDDAYSRRFGGGRVIRQDVLHVAPGNPDATIVGDLADPKTLRGRSFDCVVLTQTLHLIFDMRAAIENVHAALRPGGVLLATVPGISPIDRGAWGASWSWSLTENAARRLFAETFGPEAVLAEGYGNFTAAIGFLAGLSQTEIPPGSLDSVDPAYPLVVAVRAEKRCA